MRFSIEPKDGYLHAALFGRDTADEMRDFLLAVHAACRQHELPKILISIRQSHAVFKPEDYGLSGYVNGLVTPACQIALVGDTGEVNSANEYIELVARQQGVNVGAFRDGGASTIRSRLLDHYYAGLRATHYGWKVCKDPAAREAELLREHERTFGRLPRYNHNKAT